MTIQPTTDHPQVALPTGADPENVDNWETDPDTGVGARLVWSTVFPLPGRLATADMRVVVTQLDDGTIIDNGNDGPHIYHECTAYSPAEARQIAATFAKAAELADQWVRGIQPADASGLPALFDGLEAVHLSLRAQAAQADTDDQFGTYSRAASYVLAARDSIADAIWAVNR